MEKVKKFFHDFFIPHENNNYRARSLHSDFLSLYLIFAIFLSFSFKQIGLNNVLGFATDISVDKLYQLTNQEREKNGLPDLQYNDKLAQAAYLKAENMFAENYWAHYSPVGATPWDFIVKSGYRYEFAGENLAKNFLFSQGVIDAWMKSPTHRDNVLKKEYSEVGYAIVNGTLNGEQTTLVVQMFGKPIFGSIAQKPVDTSSKALSNQTEIETQPVVVKETSSVKSGQEALVLSQQSKKTFEWPVIGFNSNMIFFTFLLIALALDFYYASKLSVMRVGGKNLAHFVFIFFMMAALLIVSRGAII